MPIYYKNLNSQCVPIYVRTNCKNNNNQNNNNKNNNNLPLCVKNEMSTNILKTLDFEKQHTNRLFLNLLQNLISKYHSDLSIISPLDIKNTDKLTIEYIFKKLKPIKLVKIQISSQYTPNIIRKIIPNNLLFYGMSLYHFLPTNDIRKGDNYKSLGDNFTIVTDNLSDFKKYATSTTPISDNLGHIFNKLLNETVNLQYMRKLSIPMTVVPLGTTESPPTIDVNTIVSTVETELIKNKNMIIHPTIRNYLAQINESSEKTFNDVYSGELSVKNTDTSEILFSISKEEITYDNKNLEVLLNITDGMIDNEMVVNQSSVVYSESNSQYTINFSFKSFITIKNIELNLYDDNQSHPLQIIFNLNSLKISNTSIIYVTLDSSTNEVSDIYIDNVFIESLSEVDVNDNIEVVSATYNGISQNFSESQIEFIFNTTLLTNLKKFTSELLVTNFEGNGDQKSIYFNCENIIQSVPQDFTNYMNSNLKSIQNTLQNSIQNDLAANVTEVSGSTDTKQKVFGENVKLSFSYNTFDYDAKDENGNFIYHISQFSQFSNTNLTVEQVIIYNTEIRYIYYSNLTIDNKVSFSNVESLMKFEAKAGSDKSKINANYRYDINNVNFTYVPVDTPNALYFEYQNNNLLSTNNLQLNPNQIISNDTIKDMVIVSNPNSPFNLTFILMGIPYTLDINSYFSIEELVPTDIKDTLNVVYRNLTNYVFTFST